MKKLNLKELEAITGGDCRAWLGPDDNASSNANPDPLSFQFCNTCLMVAALSSNPNLVACTL